MREKPVAADQHAVDDYMQRDCCISETLKGRVQSKEGIIQAKNNLIRTIMTKHCVLGWIGVMLACQQYVTTKT